MPNIFYFAIYLVYLLKIKLAMEDIILGVEKKFRLYLIPIGSVHASQYDFIIKVYCSAIRSIILSKDECIMVDDDTFVVTVDTNQIGLGNIVFEVTAFVPDGDFEDGLRTEKARYKTNVNVVA